MKKTKCRVIPFPEQPGAGTVIPVRAGEDGLLAKDDYVAQCLEMAEPKAADVGLYERQYEAIRNATPHKVDIGEFAGQTVSTIRYVRDLDPLPRFWPNGTIDDSTTPLWLARVDGETIVGEDFDLFMFLAEGKDLDIIGPVVFFDKRTAEAA